MPESSNAAPRSRRSEIMDFGLNIERTPSRADFIMKTLKSLPTTTFPSLPDAARTPTTRTRLANLLAEPIQYIPSREFAKARLHAAILGPAPAGKSQGRLRAPAGLPPYLAALYQHPLLTAEQERHDFRQFNFLKHQAAATLARINRVRPRRADVARVEDLLRQAEDVKNRLVVANLRLVVAVARKSTHGSDEFFEVVSDGNVSLMKAIDKFDYSRGFKFSTYATWALRRNFARSIPAEYTHQSRFRTGQAELFGSFRDARPDGKAAERTAQRQHSALSGLLHRLDEREREIVSLRYGFDPNTEPHTLAELGHRLGISKERVRQLEARALVKLRRFAESGKLDDELGVAGEWGSNRGRDFGRAAASQSSPRPILA